VSPLKTWKALVCIGDSYPLSPPTGLQSARIMHFAEQVSLAKASGFIRHPSKFRKNLI
jgi:hypothetical protein